MTTEIIVFGASVSVAAELVVWYIPLFLEHGGVIMLCSLQIGCKLLTVFFQLLSLSLVPHSNTPS